MTWGQQEFWRKKIRAYSHDDSQHFNLPLYIDLPDDITADQAMVAVAFRRLVERNEVIVTEAAYRDVAVADIPALTGITSGAMKLPAGGLPVEVAAVQVAAVARPVAVPGQRLAVGGAGAAR